MLGACQRMIDAALAQDVGVITKSRDVLIVRAEQEQCAMQRGRQRFYNTSCVQRIQAKKALPRAACVAL